MEKIKRANNLWTSDSLFCKSYLNIPIESSSILLDPPSPSKLVTASSPRSHSISKHGAKSSNSCDIKSRGNRSSSDGLSCNDVRLLDSELSPPTVENGIKLRFRKEKNVKENLFDPSLPKATKANGFTHSSSTDQEGEGEESVADFLIRIDSHIAKSKNQVNSIIEQKARLTGTYSDDDLFKSTSDKPSSSSYLRRQNSARNGVLSFTRPLEETNDKPQARIMTQGRKVTSSLKRLEKQQDELFQL